MPEHLRQGSEFPPLDPAKIRLYCMVYCPFSMRVRLVLAHHNTEHEAIFINLKDKPDWFTSRIPGGKVPAIEQGGEKMVDSEMICLFLDQQHPEDSLTIASGQPAIDAAKGWWSTAFKPFHALAFEKEVTDDHKAALMKALKTFEEITQNPFISGSKVGLADYLVYPIFDRLEAMLRLSELPMPSAEDMPRLFAWLNAMRALPGVSKVRISEDRHYRFCLSQKAGSPDYDI